MPLPAGYALRARTEADLGFLCALYAQTREDELRHVAWTAAAKQAFLEAQFRLQHSHYLQHYPQAKWWVITFEGKPVGRFYAAQTARDLRVMDLALLQAHRGRGVGTALMRQAVAQARAAGIPCSLHVEPFNPALRLYQRLGFVPVETRGIYLFMERPASVEDDLVLGAAGVAGDGHHEHVQPSMPGVE